MTRPLVLSDFALSGTDPVAALAVPDSAPQAAPDTDTLEAFDNGYKNGWADCSRAEAEERRTVSADLAKNLTEALLTVEAARADLLSALGPLFEDVVATLLPRLAAEAVAPRVVEELAALADEQLNTRIELHAAPANCPSLERLVETEGIENLIVRPEPAFAEGQVSLRLGSERRDIDMHGVAERIAEAITRFQSDPDGQVPSPQIEGVA